MNAQNEELEIDFREILHVLLKKIWIILAAAVIGGLAFGLFSIYLIEPQYEATAKIYISTNSDSMVSLSDLQMSSSLADDYQELIKSRPVVESVIDSLKLDMKYGQMLKLLSIQNPDNTRIIHITIHDTDPQIAMEIANEFARVSKQQISQIMRVDEPGIVENAIAADSKSSPSNLKNTILGVLLGLALSSLVIVVLHIMDDTIKTSEDVEKYLKMNTLSAIPEEGGTDNSEKKRGSRKIRKGR